MRQISKTQTCIMLGGGMAMVVSAALTMACTLFSESTWASTMMKVTPWLFLLGAIAYVSIQRLQQYSGNSITLRRLCSIQFLSGIFLIIAGLLLVENTFHFLLPLVVNDINSYYTYVQVVHNNWVVAMLIAAVLQMYTAHRISSEMKNEEIS